MKNKKLLYVLVPATILVWGWVAWKLVLQFRGNDAAVVSAPGMQMQQELPLVQDTFSLSGGYRDPFSGIAVKKVPVQAASGARPAPKLPAVQKISPQWPSLQYGGIIKNQGSGKQRILMLINGQSAMMQVGERLENVELVKVTRDSVLLRFGKEQKWIRN